jgi:serine phosphatase RsbU (regulator of sigma subunit)
MKKNKKRIKLIVFILGLTAILIFISLAGIFFSGRVILDLAKYAYKIDQQNNKRLSSDLFYSITKETANFYSNKFKETANLVNILASNVQKQLVNSKSFNLSNNSIDLTKYKSKNFFVDTSQSIYNIYYWGDEDTVPSEVIKQLNSIKSIGTIFKSIKNMSDKYFYSVYVISVNKYDFTYPQLDAYYKNIKDKSTFDKFYLFKDFPLQLKDKNIKVNLPCIFERPYRDASDEIVMGVKTGIYNNGQLLAYVGIDFSLDVFRKSMLTNPLPTSKVKNDKSNLTEGFLFILNKDGNIITFPKKYADLFSLPKEYLNMKSYLEQNTIKLSKSTSSAVKVLSKKIKSGDSGKEEIILKGMAFDVAYSAIEETGWTLGFVIKKQYLLSPTVKTKNLLKATIKELFKKQLLRTVIFIIFTFILMFFIFRYFLHKPINKIQEKIKKMVDGDFNTDLKEEGSAEIAELASGFNFMGKKLINYIEDLKKETAERQAFETEIQIAEKIQRSILPDPASIPTNGNFILTARLNAAKNVSGDFYDFFYLNENKIAILIADVSGKGLQAAFFMATSKALIKNQCLLEHDDPGKVLDHVNKILCMDNKAQMFVTVCLAFCNIADGTATYANAGHHTGIFLRNNKIIRAENFKNIALGIYDQAEYKTGKIDALIGDTIILYTDGISEAVSPEGKEYGEKRLEKLILTNKDLHLDTLCDTIIKDVTVFECENRFDDITLLAFKRLK